MLEVYTAGLECNQENLKYSGDFLTAFLFVHFILGYIFMKQNYSFHIVEYRIHRECIIRISFMRQWSIYLLVSIYSSEFIYRPVL